jgi:hypothetical protein
MKRLHLVWLLLAAFALPVAAEGSDDLWEISVHMDDKVSGSAMTTRAQQQCLPKGAQTDDIVPLRKGCRMVNQQTSGSRVAFRFECTGDDSLAGEGDIDRPSADAYNGKLQMHGATSNGRKVDIALAFSGKRIGACAFGEPSPNPSVSAPQ